MDTPIFDDLAHQLDMPEMLRDPSGEPTDEFSVGQHDWFAPEEA